MEIMHPRAWTPTYIHLNGGILARNCGEKEILLSDRGELKEIIRTFCSKIEIESHELMEQHVHLPWNRVEKDVLKSGRIS